MTKYLLLKHYRGDHDIAAEEFAPMDQWTPEEVDAHIRFMGTVTEDLQARGEFVDAQALAPTGTFVATTARAAPRSPTARSRRPRT